MSANTNRFIITATVAAGLYTRRSKEVIKEYLEKEAVAVWAMEIEGATSAEVIGKGHAGGTVEAEPFHLNVVVKDKDGKIIQSTDPHTNEPTDVWHAYLAEDKTDLMEKALAWKADNTDQD